MEQFWEYFSVLAPSIGLGLIFWLIMRSLFRGDAGERSARAAAEEREAQEWLAEKQRREQEEARDAQPEASAGTQPEARSESSAE